MKQTTTVWAVPSNAGPKLRNASSRILSGTAISATSTTTIVVDAGAVTFAGSVVGLKTSIGVGAGALVVSGATDLTLVTGANVTISVTTPGALTLTGQAVGLRVSVTPSPGAITLAGSSAGLSVALRASSGAVTFTGQALGLKTAMSPTAGAVTFTGSAVGLKTALGMTAGAVTFTGSNVTTAETRVTPITWVIAPQAQYQQRRSPSSRLISAAAPVSASGTVVTVDAGAVTFTGSTVALVQTQAITAGGMTFAGQAVSLAVKLAPIAGAVTFTGQSVRLITTLTPTAGAVTFTGQTISFGGNTTITPIAGAVTFTGQALGLRTAVAITAGAMTWAGQAVGLATSLAPSAGAVTFTGQIVGLKRSVGLGAGAVTFAGATNITLTTTGPSVITVTTPGQMTWTGSTVGTVRSMPVSAGAMTFAGQAVALKLLVSLDPGGITFAGQLVTLTGSSIPPPTVLSNEGASIGGVPTGSVEYLTVAGPGGLGSAIVHYDFSSGLTLWKDVDRTIPVANGDQIKGVTDISDNGNHLFGSAVSVPSGTKSYPTYQTGVRHGLSVARFADHDASLALGPYVMPGTQWMQPSFVLQPFMVTLAANVTNIESHETLFIVDGVGLPWHEITLTGTLSGYGPVRMSGETYVNPGDDFADLPGTTVVNGTGWHVITAIWDGAASSLRIDGIEDAAGPMPTTASADGWYLVIGGNGGYSPIMDLGELVFGGGIDLGRERDLLEKWG